MHFAMKKNAIKPVANKYPQSSYNRKAAINSFSHDLVANAKNHIQFLSDAHDSRFTLLSLTKATASVDSKTIDLESMRRYLELWLPMVADLRHSNAQLHPPPDIAWMWHCHRLAPRQYYDYCHHHYNECTIEANPPFSMVLVDHSSGGCKCSRNSKECPDRTIDMWMERYPNENFFLDPKSINLSSLSKYENCATTMLYGFDLLGCVERQGTFLWQVSEPHYTEDEFLYDGLDNYYKFLKLRPLAAQERIILVPTFQIDLMWHTHILSSIGLYNQDCMKIMNMTMHHDDSYTDRSEESPLAVAYRATQDLWYKEYGITYVVDGAMYRGEPPEIYYSTNWPSYHKNQGSNSESNDYGWNDETNKNLIGKVGATSTGIITPPTKWASVNGVTSDGLPAFISEDSRGKALLQAPYKPNYVLGNLKNTKGYYHIETREANEILFLRITYQIRKAENQLAFAKCCCGYDGDIKRQELELIEMAKCRELLLERLRSKAPTGPTKARKIGKSVVCESDGYWTYPPILYVYAGGSCGGAVFDQTPTDCGGGGGADSGGGGSSGCGGSGGACGGGGGGCGGGGD